MQFMAVTVTEGVAGVRPAAVSLELRSDSGVMSHWKDYDQLATFSFLSHQSAAPFHRTSTDTIHVPMVPQVGEFRTGRVHQLNAHAVELPLQVICRHMVKGKAILFQAWTGPKGSRFQDNRNMKVVRLSALRTGCLYPPGIIPGTHFC
jgi:hypothetical protein